MRNRSNHSGTVLERVLVLTRIRVLLSVDSVSMDVDSGQPDRLGVVWISVYSIYLRVMYEDSKNSYQQCIVITLVSIYYVLQPS